MGYRGVFLCDVTLGGGLLGVYVYNNIPKHAIKHEIGIVVIGGRS